MSYKYVRLNSQQGHVKQTVLIKWIGKKPKASYELYSNSLSSLYPSPHTATKSTKMQLLPFCMVVIVFFKLTVLLIIASSCVFMAQDQQSLTANLQELNSTVVPLDSNTLWLEHFSIRTHLPNKFWPSIRTRPHNSNTKTRGGRCAFPPVVGRSRLHFAVNTSLSWTAFKSLWPVVALVTPAPNPDYLLPTTSVNAAIFSGH